jgi:hypothetical protein
MTFGAAKAPGGHRYRPAFGVGAQYRLEVAADRGHRTQVDVDWPASGARRGSIHLAEIRDQPHGAADLLVTVTVLFADGFGQDIGIIHYDGRRQVTWAFLAPAAAAPR